MYGRTKLKYRSGMSRFAMIVMPELLTIHSVNMVFE